MASSDNVKLSFLDLLHICDNFKWPPSEALVPWALSQHSDSPIIGLLRPAIIPYLQAYNKQSESLGRPPVWVFSDVNTGESLKPGLAKPRVSFHTSISTSAQRTEVMKELCEGWRHAEIFADVIGPKKWRGEMYPIYANPFGAHDYPDEGANNDSEWRGNFAFEMERAACALFGAVTYGVHMTVYEVDEGGMKIWVGKRALTKQTWPGYLDNTIAGGIPSGTGIFEAMVKESMEEASVEEALIRKHAQAVGGVSYFLQTDKGWLQPEIEYVYDIRVPPSVDPTPFRPKPLDGEVESFQLLPLDEVITLMCEGRFKPNCAIVLIDFFVRHGILTPDNEPHFMEIMTGLHGRFNYEEWGA